MIKAPMPLKFELFRVMIISACELFRIERMAIFLLKDFF
jgi:hypothetical protein